VLIKNRINDYKKIQATEHKTNINSNNALKADITKNYKQKALQSSPQCAILSSRLREKAPTGLLLVSVGGQ